MKSGAYHTSTETVGGPGTGQDLLVSGGDLMANVAAHSCGEFM